MVNHPNRAKKIKIPFELTRGQAADFAQLVKRLCTRGIGPTNLDLVTSDEEVRAEDALIALRDALDQAGFSPR